MPKRKTGNGYWDSLESKQEDKFVRLAWDSAEFEGRENAGENTYRAELYDAILTHALGKHRSSYQGSATEIYTHVKGLRPLKIDGKSLEQSLPLVLTAAVDAMDIAQNIARRVVTHEEAQAIVDAHAPHSPNGLFAIRKALNDAPQPLTQKRTDALAKLQKSLDAIDTLEHATHRSVLWRELDRLTIAEYCVTLEKVETLKEPLAALSKLLELEPYIEQVHQEAKARSTRGHEH